MEVGDAGEPIREFPKMIVVVNERFAGICAVRRGDDGELRSDVEENVVDELQAFGRWMLGRPAAEAEGLVGGVGDAPEE